MVAVSLKKNSVTVGLIVLSPVVEVVVTVDMFAFGNVTAAVRAYRNWL